MKLNKIKSEKQLKAGAYIRALINFHGKFWIEYVDLSGRVFNCQSRYMPGYRKIHSKSKYRHEQEWFIGSLGVPTPSGNQDWLICIPFSNKAWNYLSSIKDVRQFAEAISGERVSDEKFFDMKDQWNFQIQSDKHFEEENLY